MKVIVKLIGVSRVETMSGMLFTNLDSLPLG